MKTKKTGLQMLRAIGKGMANKHRAMKPMGNNFLMAPSKSGLPSPDVGGTGPQEIARTGLGKGGGNVGDWPYNKFARKPKTKKARKGKAGVHRAAKPNAFGRSDQFDSAKSITGWGGRSAGETWGVSNARKGKAKKGKKFAHKGHTHKSRKAMKAC